MILIGDLVNKGPKTPAVLQSVIDWVKVGAALCVPGNQDMALVRALKGEPVQLTSGLRSSLDQIDAIPDPAPFREGVIDFFEGLPSHWILDEGRLVVAHAGIEEGMIGRHDDPEVRDFAIHGRLLEEVDERGKPKRYPFADHYQGDAWIVYGHTPVREPLWKNRTVNIDTGCVYGGALTALRYPEMETVSVAAGSANPATEAG